MLASPHYRWRLSWTRNHTLAVMRENRPAPPAPSPPCASYHLQQLRRRPPPRKGPGRPRLFRALRPLGRRHRGPGQAGPHARSLRQPGLPPGARRDVLGPLPRDAHQEQGPAGAAGGAVLCRGLLRRGDGGARHQRLPGEWVYFERWVEQKVVRVGVGLRPSGVRKVGLELGVGDRVGSFCGSVFGSVFGSS